MHGCKSIPDSILLPKMTTSIGTVNKKLSSTNQASAKNKEIDLSNLLKKRTNIAEYFELVDRDCLKINNISNNSIEKNCPTASLDPLLVNYLFNDSLFDSLLSMSPLLGKKSCKQLFDYSSCLKAQFSNKCSEKYTSYFEKLDAINKSCASDQAATQLKNNSSTNRPIYLSFNYAKNFIFLFFLLNIIFY